MTGRSALNDLLKKININIKYKVNRPTYNTVKIYLFYLDTIFTNYLLKNETTHHQKGI